VKDKVSPAIVAVAVIVAVVIAGFIGFKFFQSSDGNGANNVDEYRKKYAPNAPPGPLSMKIPPSGNTSTGPMHPGAPPGYHRP
jgi:hypothetical protein